MSKEQPGGCSSYDLRQQKRDERRTNYRQQEEQRLIREEKRKSYTLTKVYDIEVTEEEDNLCDTNWELKAVSQKKVGKKDVMGDISVCADRLGLSIRERTIFASSVAKSLGADIEDINIFVQTAWRHG